MNINITLSNGSIKTFSRGITAQQIAENISNSLAKKALVAYVNNQVWDLSRPINHDAIVEILTWEHEAGKQAFWHSSAHLLAEAISALYPNINFGIGPSIANGFYYDVDFGDTSISTADFENIEKKMLELAGRASEFVRIEINKVNAIAHFTKNFDPYKLELLGGLEDGHITFYKQGEFTDLCKGPHIPNTKFIKAIKLLNIAGAYWRGDVSRKQLTRIYGITFPTQKELDDHLYLLEEAKKRNHQKLGKELKLFTFSEKVGLGLPLWLPNGAIIRQRIMDFIYKDQLLDGYLPVITPHIARKELYITSGHYHKYGEDSFQPIKTPNENEEYFLKPMNCPHHCEIYKSEPRSYKDLPINFCEFGTVYRYEQHGELHGLARTRCMTQDDAHIFCTQDQIKEVFGRTIDRVIRTFKALSFDKYVARISIRDKSKPDKYIGDLKDWDTAEKAIREVVEEKELKSFEGEGEAAFYGPKLDFMVQDALGRDWQLGTIQLDYQLPKRFELEYVGADNKKHCPIMIHRAPLGTFERLMAILLEHTAGNLPLWLAPIQVSILTLSENFEDYAQQVHQNLIKHDIFSNIDARSENLSRKILDAEMRKIPYIIIVGKKEVEQNTVSIRQHGVGDLGTRNLDEFIITLRSIIDSSKF
jgi:threonyl-tRNA synthetase